MRRSFVRHLIGVLVVTSLVAACGSSDSEDEGTTAKADPKRAIVSAIAGLGGDLYNTNWAGQPCVVVSKETTCPAGGQVKITGSYTCPTTNGSQTTSLDFTYEMTDCVEVRNGLTLTMTGKMTHTGSSTNVTSIVTSETIAYKSIDKVAIVAVGDAYESLTDSCEFAITSRLSEAGGDSKVTGTLCGESFGLTK